MANGSDLSVYRSTPVVDFTSQDFDSISEDLIAYAQSKFSDRWTDFNEDQFAVIFLELIAYAADLISYQINSVIREAFVATATRRQNLQNLGKPFEYTIPGASSAAVDIKATLDPAGTYPFTITKGANVFSNGGSGDDEVLYQPTADLVVAAYPVGGTVTVPCTEGELFEDLLVGVSTGLASQRWQFPQQGVILDSASIRVGLSSWTTVAGFVRYGSSAQVCRLLQTDDGNTYVTFGDGANGAIPALGQSIYATFRVGGGSRGNLPKNTIETRVQAHSNILGVTNPEKASDGANATSMRAARGGFVSVLATQRRGVTGPDYEMLASAVSGVAKVRAAPGTPIGQRIIRLFIAPAGGGEPTSTLKNNVITAFRGTRMITNRVRVYGARYVNLRFSVLLHVNPSYRASDVISTTRNGLVNLDGTGLLNFDALNFEGVEIDSNGNEELLLSQTRLQNYFADLQSVGLDRAEVLQFDVEPFARTKDSGNSGNGSVDNIVLNSKQRRREYLVQLVSSTQYAVYERIIGRISSLSDNTLTDDTKVFENEGVSDFSSYRLIPLRDINSSVPVSYASGTNIVSVGESSLFAMTMTGSEYVLYDPTPTLVDVGSEYSSADGSVKFTVNAGGQSFIAGDEFTIDVFPHIGDIRLRFDEYPELLNDDFVTRSSGGSRV